MNHIFTKKSFEALLKRNPKMVLVTTSEGTADNWVVFTTVEMSHLFEGLNPKFGQLNDRGGSYSTWAGIKDLIFFGYKFNKGKDAPVGTFGLYYYAKKNCGCRNAIHAALAKEGLVLDGSFTNREELVLSSPKIDNFCIDDFICNGINEMSEKIVRATKDFVSHKK